MSEWPITACGDDLISIPTRDARDAQRISEHLRLRERFREVVPGIASVVVQFDASRTNFADAMRLLNEELAGVVARDETMPPSIVVPVMYGGQHGPDLDATCAKLELSREEFIALHAGRDYRIDMLGFTPGFAYVGGLDERLDVPRLAAPRPHVPAGSIGIAGGRTGIYALQGPGGWPLIGRTQMRLFNPDADDPFVLRAGATVRFEPVGAGGT